MPWKVDHIMDQRIEFAREAIHTDNFLALCQKYNISRPTGYKWLKRFEQAGASGMDDQSRKPKNNPNELREKVVCELIKLKNAHPNWGPRKIRELYRRKYKHTELPSESSVKRVLKRAGLSKTRRRVQSTPSARLNSGLQASEPNEVWTVDFKGWWRGRDGMRIEPLTVRDEYSRKILEVRLLKNNRTAGVIECFKSLFRKYGLPKYIRSDNGAPFAASNSLLGLSRFSVWLTALGINLERGRPGCPQDNGAHERMHLDIYRELEINSIGFDQQAFNMWKEEFNGVRPHESLSMQTPDEVYQISSTKYEEAPDEIEYPKTMQTRKLHRRDGWFTYESERYRLSSALGGWNVGIRATCHTYTEVWFNHLLLGHINRETRSFEPLEHLKKKINNLPHNL